MLETARVPLVFKANNKQTKNPEVWMEKILLAMPLSDGGLKSSHKSYKWWKKFLKVWFTLNLV